MNFLKKILEAIFGGNPSAVEDNEFLAVRPIHSIIKVSSSFGPRKDPVTGKEKSFHYGIDFSCPDGTCVVSMYEGRVFKVGWQDQAKPKAGFGKRVWIKSTIDGVEYDHFYAHMSHLSVTEGMQVSADDMLGLSGNTGKSTGPHLHVQLRPADRSVKGIDIKFKEAIV